MTPASKTLDASLRPNLRWVAKRIRKSRESQKVVNSTHILMTDLRSTCVDSVALGRPKLTQVDASGDQTKRKLTQVENLR